MKILKAALVHILLSFSFLTSSILAAQPTSIIKTVNIQQANSDHLELVHRRYYRYPPPHYYPRGYGYGRYRPYRYRPYYYGYPRYGYIGPNYYGYYPYPYYRRWYGPGVHLHFGW